MIAKTPPMRAPVVYVVPADMKHLLIQNQSDMVVVFVKKSLIVRTLLILILYVPLLMMVVPSLNVVII